MGGTWRKKKLTVEECYALDVDLLVRQGSIDLNNHTSGTIRWNDVRAGVCEIEFECDHARELRLRYRSGEQNQDYTIGLSASAMRPFGGVRFWLHCPRVKFTLERGPHDCGRRARKLYLTPEGDRFVCRECANVTYESCQKSHCREPEATFGLASRLFDGFHR